MLINSKEVYTRFAKYTIGEMNCPVCELNTYKLWGKCLKRETVYQPEIPELMTQYVKCKKCGVVYAKNAVIGYSLYVTPPKLDPRIQKCFFIEGHGDLVPEYPIRARFNLELVKLTYGKSSDFSLLDVGCSSGEFLELALNSRIEAEGVDVNPEYADKARKRTNATIYEGDICEVSIPKKYDVVTFTEVIEHILEPNNFMAKILKILNPGGMVFVTAMPNTSSMRIRFYKCENSMIRDTFSHHVLYNPRSMRYLLQKHGFADIHFYHYRREGWSVKNICMGFIINQFGYFDNQVIATAWK